jgi:hypothetical protein
MTRGSAPTLVTEVSLQDPTMASHVDAWAELIRNLAWDTDLRLHDRVELFLEPSLDNESCRYYLIDHDTRGVFWLDSYETEQLGLPSSVSEQHLSELFHIFLNVRSCITIRAFN